MEQNRYNSLESDIILSLSKKENHLRGISNEAGKNHMSVKRMLDKLYEENIVDSKKEGRNKVFFLKENLKARAKIISSELCRQTRAMEEHPVLKQIFEKIIHDERITMAILFGSYAKNIPHRRSDIDIYIETSDEEIKRDVERINSRINVKIGEFNKENLFIKEIIKNHVIIKGLEEYYGKAN